MSESSTNSQSTEILTDATIDATTIDILDDTNKHLDYINETLKIIESFEQENNLKQQQLEDDDDELSNQTEQQPRDNEKGKEKDFDKEINTDIERIKDIERDLEKDIERDKDIDIDNVIDKDTIGRVKKSVSFDPNDEQIRKFTSGDPIVDQRNPFKNGQIKRTPPPVPTKRSTLSVRKTVTQQLRERERAKEKEREQLRNETNARKKLPRTAGAGGGIITTTTPNGNANAGGDEFITTEEVLKQSKYVKTYIKNPDPVFVYDPTVLARLKFEELREITTKVAQPKRKQQQQHQQTGGVAAATTKSTQQPQKPTRAAAATFKKCSKPNYPELANIKIKIGTDPDPDADYLNPAEVTKNAKKFDERVKKLQISSDDDLDDIAEPLTKSESSDELSNHQNHNYQAPTSTTPSIMNVDQINGKQPLAVSKRDKQNGDGGGGGTFTNTISSQEFQEYLDRKGLALMPKVKQQQQPKPQPRQQPPVAASAAAMQYMKPVETFANSRQQPQLRKPVETFADSLAALRKSNTNSISNNHNNNNNNGNGNKKLSVLQRLSNSLFAARRKTTPGNDELLQPRTGYGEYNNANGEKVIPRKPRRTLLAHDYDYDKDNDDCVNVDDEQRTLKRPISSVSNRKPFERTLERQSCIPRRVTIPQTPTTATATTPQSSFARCSSMDRNQIRSYNNDGHSRRGFWPVAIPNATSTPLKQQQPQQQQPQVTTPHQRSASQLNVDWEQLRAIKEVTDRQLYHKVLQQQQQHHQQQPQPRQQSEENIYEHLPVQAEQQYFVRGGRQRNTFSGITGDRRQLTQQTPVASATTGMQQQHPRCQSALDGIIVGGANSQHSLLLRRGYESENENPIVKMNGTPVVMRRKESSLAPSASSRRIGGLLTREEILEKVKEFCRKSITKSPQQLANKMQPIYERHNNNGNANGNGNVVISTADISPVSYASVETHKRPISTTPQMSMRQQQQQHMQQQHQQQHHVPIYAHVNKRHSLMSNDSDTTHSQYRLQPTTTDYILVDGNGMFVQPAQRFELVLRDGRSTPLILDRASGHQASQIYWTPQLQHQQQRLQQYNTVAMSLSPRYTAKQGGYPVPAPRLNVPNQTQQQRVLTLQHHPVGSNVQLQQLQQHQQHHPHYATIVPAPRNHLQQQQLQYTRNILEA